MCPDSHRHLTKWYKRDVVQDNENIASGLDTNRSLDQSKKETENQQLLDRPNKIVLNDKSKVMKINNALTSGDKDYPGYFGYENYKNGRHKPTAAWPAINTNTSLGQSKKDKENQQIIYRRNKIVCDKSKVMKISNALTSGDKYYFFYDNYKTDIEKPTITWPKLVTKKKTLSKDEIDLFYKLITEIISSKTARPSFGCDYSHKITRSGKTTLPVAAINDLHKPAVTGQTGNQLKQPNVSRGTDSQISFRPKEPKTSLDLEQKPSFPNDSDENLDSEPVVTDEQSGIDDSPIIVSTGNDETTSHGEVSMDSDYDFEVMKLFAWLDKKDWARSYYDCDDGVVIHVEPGQVEASQRLLAEEFPNFQRYSVVETEPGVCTYSADTFEENEEKLKETNNNKTPNAQNSAPTINTQGPTEVDLHSSKENTETAKAHSLEGEMNGQATVGCKQEHVELCSRTPAKSQSVQLQPGDTITSDEHPARFSGRVGSKGLTVAHIGPSNDIHHYCYSSEKQYLIGTMEKVLEVDVSYTRGGDTVQRRTTADLGLLHLTRQCRVKNIICYKGIYRLKLYKGSIKKGTLLRIIDQYGHEKHGELTSDCFNLKRNRQDSSLVGPNVDDWSREVYNMLRIQNEKSAISAEGDSGTLVTSVPEEGSNELFVYGIVTHLHKENKCDQPSATIANRLSDILGTFIDGIHGGSRGLRHPKSNEIDFTEDEH